MAEKTKGKKEEGKAEEKEGVGKKKTEKKEEKKTEKKKTEKKEEKTEKNAKKKDEEEKEEYVVYTIPLRSVFQQPEIKRAKKAAGIVREYVKRRMKDENVVLDEGVNSLLWSRGIKKPPRRIKVKASKKEGGVVVSLSD